MPTPLWANATVVAGVNAVTALLNTGTIKIYTGAQPAVNSSPGGTLLATMTFGSTAFPTSVASGSGCTATANAISSGTAGNSGTAGCFALFTSGSTLVMSGDVGTSGASLNLNSLSITSGATVSCSSFLITQVQT
jgi:hypothetical protein